jgi:DNA adenine methylase
MGSKHSILPFLYRHLAQLEFDTVLDAFSGSAAVSYLLKAMGKQVTSNDFLTFAYHTANACVANNSTRLTKLDLEALLAPNLGADDFITRTFEGLYFSKQENQLMDNLTANIRQLVDKKKQSMAYAAIARACFRRRPRGLFTYTGVRYLDGRRDLRLSLEEHFREGVNTLNASVFSRGQRCRATNLDIFALPRHLEYDLVYFDPPYVSEYSDNDYTRRYHFVEGLTRYWSGLEILEHTQTRKFKRYPSLFDSKRTIYQAFAQLFERHKNSILVVSYSSNSIPAKVELLNLMKQHKRKVKVYQWDHQYSFGTHAHKVGDNQNKVQEFLFIGE